MRATLAALIASALLTAQQHAPVTLTTAQIENPSTDSWPTYNGDYSGRRYSPLIKINTTNVKNLSLAWLYDLPGGGTVKGTPLQVGGVLYFTTCLLYTSPSPRDS